jgi:hypothetical protein
MKTTLQAVIFVLLTFTFSFAQENESASVSGRVTTLQGEVLENVEVQFFELEGIRGISPKETLVKTTSTDKEGNYKISGLPYGQYRVNFVLPYFGHTEVWRFYLWRKAHRVLDIGIPIGYTHGLREIIVSGQVQGTNNQKIKDVTVTLVNAFNPNETQQTRTDKDGKYKITRIQPGQYIVYVTKPNFATKSIAADLGNGAKVELNFTMEAIKQKPPGGK